jgi:AcrR family transcriptional regulator
MKIIKKGRPKTFDKHNADSIAMYTYWREGMDNVSLNEICRKIGESKPSVYREYGGENGLKASALKLYLDKRVNILAEFLFSENTFVENIKSALNFLINNHFDNEYSYPCLYNKESWFPSKAMSPECRKIIYEKDKEILLNLKNKLTEAIERGEVSSEVDIDVFTNYLHHQLKLIATLSNNKVPKEILNGMVSLIMEPLKKN